MRSFQSMLQFALGPMLIGFCLDIFLFGVTTVQTYLYYLAFPNDHKILQCLVYGVYLVGTFQTGLAIHDLYLLFSVRYGWIRPNIPKDQPAWNSGTYFIVTIPICGSIVACAVQGFYAHRIRALKEGMLIPSLVGVLSALQWAGAIMVAAGTYSPSIGKKGAGTSTDKQQSMDNIGFVGSLLWGCVSSACDILIAVCMVSYLLKVRTFARHGRARITKLMRLIVETGSLTAAVSVSFVLTFKFAPGGFFMIPGLSIGKLYNVSLLVLLNNRFHIHGGRQKEASSFLLPSELAEMDTVLTSVPISTSGSTTVTLMGASTGQHILQGPIQMHELTDTNTPTSNVQQPQLTESVPRPDRETRLAPTDETQTQGAPNNALIFAEVAKAEDLAASKTTIQGVDLTGPQGYTAHWPSPSIGGLLKTAYMRQNPGETAVLEHPRPSQDRDMLCGHGDLTAQGISGLGLLDRPPGVPETLMTDGLSDLPKDIESHNHKHDEGLANVILGPRQETRMTSILVHPTSQISFPQSAPKETRTPNTPVASQVCKYNSSSPIAGSSPVAISSPLLPAKCSPSSSPTLCVGSPQLSSPVMIPSSPVVSSSPLLSSPSPLACVTTECAIPELLLDACEDTLDLNVSVHGPSTPSCEVVILQENPTASPGSRTEPEEVDKTRKGRKSITGFGDDTRVVQIKRHSPPNPKHPTVAAQRKEHEKLSKPFRPPHPTKLEADSASRSISSNKLVSGPKDNTKSDSARTTAKIGFTRTAKKLPLTGEENGHRHGTIKAAAQFKSPLIPSGTIPKAAPAVRLTPAIQMLERKLQILKRATKIKEENEEDVLRDLITKWTGAGREVAWEVWAIVKDNIREEPDHGHSTTSGKRSFQDEWSWEMGDDKRHKKIEEGDPHSVAQNEVGGAEPMERVGLMKVPMVSEDPDEPHHTLGTMLRQLGIDPQILGWDDEEEIFKEVDDEV